MVLHQALTISAALLAACLVSSVLAADTPPAADAPRVAKKKMEMDQPMSTKMMKPGMKMGDVKKDADQRARDMKPKLDREEKSMDRGKPK